jgi:hypothetical protein
VTSLGLRSQEDDHPIGNSQRCFFLQHFSHAKIAIQIGDRQLEQEYRRYQQDQPRESSEDEREQIRDLATDLPALWEAASTTDDDRKEILRQVIEKISVNVEAGSEWVEIRVHWAGGQQTYSRVRRPVAGTTQLSRWTELKIRLRELKSTGLSAAKIADCLHEEGFKPAQGSRVTPEVVRVWLSRNGLSTQRQQPPVELAANEWTIPQIVNHYQTPQSTVHGWIRRHQVSARQLGGGGGRWIVQATPAALDFLVNNQRKRSHVADQENDDPAGSTEEAVSRGAL